MRYFFIDLENVKSEGLEGVLSLGSDDNVIIFYSENAMNLTIPALENLNNSKASKKFIKTNYIGKNAMDFQIVSLFGAMIERNKQGSFYIISQDNGFRSAVSFCESYFESYHPLCGVHPTIIAAITDEMKKSVGKAKPAGQSSKAKAQPKPVAGTKKEKPESQPKPAAQNKSENQAKPETQDNASVQDKPVSEESAAATDNTALEQAPSPAKKKRRRKKKNTATAAENAQEQTVEDNDADTAKESDESANNDSEDVTSSDEPAANEETPTVNRLGYIYETLGELLSTKTIDIYASTIDEGIARCANRDELHEFFRGRYGDDEGEALYKVMQSDFEAMKQARPRKASSKVYPMSRTF